MTTLSQYYDPDVGDQQYHGNTTDPGTDSDGNLGFVDRLCYTP